nr:enoyl-CoA hydratase [bacterium]
MSASNFVTLSTKGEGIAVVTIDRPEALNALNSDVMQ